MVVLVVFAVLAGAGTALSPCVLPVLPALLSAGGVGGRRRPLGVVLGLSITFTVTIVGVATVIDGVGLGSDPLRDVAIAVLLAFGLAMLAPGIAARIEAPLSRLARLGPRSAGGGFVSGLLVGAALGFVYTPCAGPILAAVITVSAATGRSVAVAVAYAFGSAAALLIVTNVDVSFDQFVAQKIPEASLTASLERSDAVAKRLHAIDARKPKFTTPLPAGP